MLQAGRSRVQDPMRWMKFLIYLILQAALGPGVSSASIRNECQKQKNASREQRAVGASDWQPYRRLWADCLDNVGSLTCRNPIGLHGLDSRQNVAQNLLLHHFRQTSMKPFIGESAEDIRQENKSQFTFHFYHLCVTSVNVPSCNLQQRE
jgi:hypothetical protein